MSVNFIADPWENGDRLITYANTEWFAAYRKFRERLHWLLLWSDSVRIADSFMLFNRQIEYWFIQARDRNESREALGRVFEDRVLTVALRTQPNETFQSLADIDRAHVRGNDNFIYFLDGTPRESVIKDFDDYLGLPDSRYPFRYTGQSRPEKTRAAISRALVFDPEFAEIFEQFRSLRETLPEHVATSLLEMPDSDWTRSSLYRLLGFGRTRDGDRLEGGTDLVRLPIRVRQDLRYLVDWAFYHALDDVFRLPARFPAEKPLLDFDQLYAVDKTDSAWKQEKKEAELVFSTLAETPRGSVSLEGDLPELLRRFRDLEIEDIWQIRNTSEFANYRRLHGDFAARGPSALNDAQLCADIVDTTFKCLATLGSRCDCEISRSDHGQVALRLLNTAEGAGLVVWGLAIIIGSVTGASLSLPSAATARSVRWLTCRLMRYGEPDRPLRANVSYIGTIRTTKGSNEGG